MYVHKTEKTIFWCPSIPLYIHNIQGFVSLTMFTQMDHHDLFTVIRKKFQAYKNVFGLGLDSYV